MIEFWFEFASTHSYPAAMRIDRMAASSGVKIKWKPFLLGPIFKDRGWTDSPFNLYPDKGRYMWRDVERICAADGIAFNMPSRFPRNGLLAARVACCFQECDGIAEFVRTVYTANFVDDMDISSPEVIANCLASTGQDADELISRAQSQAAKIAFAEQTQTAIRHGIFGSPSFIAGDELFWGNDRLQQALDWATESVNAD